MKQPENQRASKICHTLAARDVAIGIAKNQGLEMVVHGVNGKIREKTLTEKLHSHQGDKNITPAICRRYIFIFRLDTYYSFKKELILSSVFY